MDILIVLTPNFNIAATMGFVDPFRAANYLDGDAIFHWHFASLDGGSVPASNGASMLTDPLADHDRKFDLVLVSSSWTPERQFNAAMFSALRRHAHRGSVMGGLDTGAFLLAKAGLLKDAKATVHYEHIDAMIELFPDTEVTEDLFVFDGKRISCCGGGASVDFALHILRRACDDRLANMAARYVFQQNLRPEGAQQNPGMIEPLGRAAPALVRDAIKLMEQHLEDPLTISDISDQLGVSPRRLDRHFEKSIGKGPATYYRDIRLDRARGLVTQTDMPLATVAVAAGFNSQAHFSKSYKSRFGLAPRDDRVQGRIPFEYRAWPMHRKGERQQTP